MATHTEGEIDALADQLAELLPIPRDLAPERIREMLGSRRYGRSLSVLAETSSTNDDVRRAAEQGAAAGHAVVADVQRAGRGQRGRTWSSTPGADLCVSIADRPAVDPEVLPVLTLAVGLGVADAVETLLADGRRCRIKWPNDVWIDGRKCAGVLVETSGSGNRLGPVVIGIGLNVNRREWPAELRARATSIAESLGAEGRIDRARALAQLLTSVEAWVDRFVAQGPAGVVAALNQRLALAGEQVTVGDLRGRLVAVAESGAALLETDQGLRQVVSGSLERAC